MKNQTLLAIAAAALLATSAQAQVACNGRFATIVGTLADEVITGTAGDDIIDAGFGNDTIDGGGGNDLICGNYGDDVIVGGAGDDDLLGGPGNDTLTGGAGDDTLQGEAGTDACDGTTGIDSADVLCETRSNLDVAVTPLTLHAADGTPLDGSLYAPAGDLAAPGTRRVGFVMSHGAQGDHTTGVPRLAGIYGATRGMTVLALNRRDWGVAAGGGDTLFEDATRDLGVGVDFLGLLGFEQVFVGGHSQGTTNAGVYPGLVSDTRLAGVGLYGTVSDGRRAATDVLFGFGTGLYDQHITLANDLVANGQAQVVRGWMTVFGVEVFRSPRTFLSYWGPDSLSVVEREIVHSAAPVLLLRVDGDEFTPDAWSNDVLAAATGAGVDATYTVIPYPPAQFDRSNTGGNAHGFLGVEREMIQLTLDWLAAREPLVDEFTTAIAAPAQDAGNYIPFASAGDDVEADAPAAALDARRSTDIDGTIASYAWTQVDGAPMTLDDPASAQPAVSTSAFGVQDATFRVTVTDDDGASASDTVSVQLDGGSPPAQPPILDVRIDAGGSGLDTLALALLVLAACRRRH